MELDKEYLLSDEQISSYKEKGHLLVRELLRQPELKTYKEAICATVEIHNAESRPLSDRDTYGKAFLQIMNLWRENDMVKKFVLSKRFGKVAAQLMGVEHVCLYHDQALFKEPGGGHTPWHQDQYYWPLDTEKTITMWMPLIDVDQSMGLMEFASGSHKKGYLLEREISDESHEFFDSYIRKKNFQVEGCDSMKAGDATFHSGWTLHNAGANTSGKMREVMTIIYYPKGTKILEPDHEWRKRDLEVWLGGQKPGQEALSHLNPVIF